MLNIKQLAFLISLAWIIFAVSAELKTNEPQFIFAEFIRRKLEHDVQDLTPRSGNERNIISTIEPYSVQGISGSGFEIAKENRLNMAVNFDGILSKADNIQETKVWLFPSYQEQLRSGDTIQLNVLISVTTPSMKGEKRKRIAINWNTTISCLSLDVSIPAKKLLKQLQLRNEKEGNISIQITGVKETRQPPVPSLTLTYSDEEICQELGTRKFAKPFIVVKYAREIMYKRIDSLAHQYVPMAKRETLTSSSSENKNDSKNATTPTTASCRAIDMQINLTQITRSVIVDPQVVNVRDCSGTCNLTIAHAIFKYLHNHANSIPQPPISYSSENAGACCVPAELDPITALTRTDTEGHNMIYHLVEIPNAIVKSCHCLCKNAD
jgi:hypothetical protein